MLVDMKICYLRASQMHSIDAQRRELERVGFNDLSDDANAAYIDAKPKRGEAGWWWRAQAIHACRQGEDDELWVAWPSVWADNAREALDGLRQLTERGAILCIATTGERFSYHADAASGLELAYKMEQDAKRRITSRATAASVVAAGRRRAARAKKWAEAKRMWLHEPGMTGKQVAEATGFSRAYLNLKLGPRGTPRFGKKTP